MVNLGCFSIATFPAAGAVLARHAMICANGGRESGQSAARKVWPREGILQLRQRSLSLPFFCPLSLMAFGGVKKVLKPNIDSLAYLQVPRLSQ